MYLLGQDRKVIFDKLLAEFIEKRNDSLNQLRIIAELESPKFLLDLLARDKNFCGLEDLRKRRKTLHILAAGLGLTLDDLRKLEKESEFSDDLLTSGVQE